MPASGRHSHKGHSGNRHNRKICCSIPAASSSPVFALRVAAKLYKFEFAYLPSLCTFPQPKASAERKKLAIQCMSQVTEWWSGCRGMFAQS